MQMPGRRLNCLVVTSGFLETSLPNTVENMKFINLCPAFRASTLSSAVSSLSSTGMSFSRMDEKEKQQALEEEQARLQALKVTEVILCNTKSPLNQGVRLSTVAAERQAPAGLIVTVVTFFLPLLLPLKLLSVATKF